MMISDLRVLQTVINPPVPVRWLFEISLLSILRTIELSLTYKIVLYAARLSRNVVS